ncbi:MAG: hypothetical protein AAF598_10035 [Bacteroidota bacterium]
MLKVFQKLRRQLLGEGKLRAYFIYAFGEILLIVIGILIALQVSNWNESRKSEDQFKAILEQIYTVLDQDIDRVVLYTNGISEQINFIDSIQIQPTSIDPALLPHLLYYIDLDPDHLRSEVSNQLDYLEFNPESLDQSNLNKTLVSYGNSNEALFLTNWTSTVPILKKANLPIPAMEFGYSTLNNLENIDRSFFNAAEIETTQNLLANEQLQQALKSTRSKKELDITLLSLHLSLARTCQNAITDYYPKVKLLYSEIGVVGEATVNNNWTDNIPLTRTDPSGFIWEGELRLNDGFVKFREGNNWNFNWGGNAFPNGASLSYGKNIQVQAGDYRVVFDLWNKTYQFTRKNAAQ